MPNKMTMIVLTLICLAGLLSACGKAEEISNEASEKIDTITTEAADAAVKKIKTPLNKARATRNLGDERTKAMDEALQKQ